MSQPYEELNDLFDFPEVEGLEDFGLVPPVPSGMAIPSEPSREMPAQEPALPAATAGLAPETASAQGGAEQVNSLAHEPRPNPPVPADIENLDEDLFEFHELFSLEDDPYRNGTLGADGMPANDMFIGDPIPEPTAQPTTAEAQAPSVPEAQAPAAPAAVQPPAPAAPLPTAQPAAAAAASGQDMFDGPSLSGEPRNGRDERFSLARDRGPRILLPEDVPYSGNFEKDRTLWVLVGCFLAFITLIAFATHRASQDFRETLHETTGMLADAMVQRGEAQSFPATSSSIDAGAQPGVVHTVEQGQSAAQELPKPADSPAAAPTESSPNHAEFIDPRDYGSTHDFAVGNAKALLSEGRFEDARRLLNHVLANQARIPLSPSLREEIDYLIPLTYFEQGTATAPVRTEARRTQEPKADGENS